jgi:hypothetical protein
LKTTNWVLPKAPVWSRDFDLARDNECCTLDVLGGDLQSCAGA